MIDTIPTQASYYRADLARAAQAGFGLTAPVADLAGQVHQESHWNPRAKSQVGAEGLAQFMPKTAQWIGGIDTQLAAVDPYNPIWALQSLVKYDRWLWDRIKAQTACDRMAFVFSGYNGGLGYVYKRQKLSPSPGDYLRTSPINPGITAGNQAENQNYPRVILWRFASLYKSWGKSICLK